MNKNNNTLESIRQHLVTFIESCLTRRLSDDHEYLTDSFIFDNITLLSDIDFTQNDLMDFPNVQLNIIDKSVEGKVRLGLEYFAERLGPAMRKKTIRYMVEPSPEPTISSMFMGLNYTGNNDSSYKDIPSALSLATFKV